MLAVSIVSCAEKLKGLTIQKFSHAIQEHSEFLVTASEEDIAALFDS